jgi:hypothetical protein
MLANLLRTPPEPGRISASERYSERAPRGTPRAPRSLQGYRENIAASAALRAASFKFKLGLERLADSDNSDRRSDRLRVSESDRQTPSRTDWVRVGPA